MSCQPGQLVLGSTVPGSSSSTGKGLESGLHDRTDLGRLPDPNALEGLKTGEPVNEHSSPAGDQFSLDTALTSLLTDPHKTKSAISVGPVSPPVPRRLRRRFGGGNI